MPTTPRADAAAIWDAARRAADPDALVRAAVAAEPSLDSLRAAPRLLVVGAGKAGAAMARGLEAALPDRLDAMCGVVNVPAGVHPPTSRIRLHPARPAGMNEPTAAGAAGAEEMLQLLSSAGPDDAAVCLLSGGGSALLPAPAEGITLADKLAVTRLLHRSGATIDEMNCVRKHLSRVKGGRLAAAFRGRLLLTLAISDVVGDPLDVIASGPTAPDPTTFADAVAVLAKYDLTARVPATVSDLLHRNGHETLKQLPRHVVNRVIGSNRTALDAAAREAEFRGYRVLDLGAFVEGETAAVATAVAGVVRSIRRDGKPVAPPACVLIGGETTVTLGERPGTGGRNQEFVLAVLHRLAATPEGMTGVVVLSGGTDGEDGPTDAAGAVADELTWAEIRNLHLDAAAALRRHDAYPLFAACGALLKPGLTGTNVMDVRVVLVT
jgi:glycerate 2-kinase